MKHHLLLKPQHLRQMNDARKRHPDVWCYEDERGLEIIWPKGNMAVLPVRKIRAYLSRLDAGESE